MPIDPSIISGIKQPQFESPTNALMNLLQVSSAQKQNRLADLTYGEKERESSENMLMNRAYKESTDADGKTNRNMLLGKVAEYGMGARLHGMQKNFAELDKEQAITGKNNAEAAKAAQEAAGHQFEMAGQLASAWAQNPAVTQQSIRSGLAAALHSKVIGNDIYQAKLAELDGLPDDPRSLNQWATGTLQQVMKSKESMSFIKPDANATLASKTQKEIAEANNFQSDQNSRRVAAGQKRANELKAEENGITRSGIVGKRTQDIELKLQDDYRNESKGFSETSTAMKKVFGAISTADKNPGSALAAGTAFMKLLDPNSVVRESELGMALNASGWFDRASNVASTLQSGKVMTATQKVNLQAAAEDLFEEAKAAQREVDAAYRRRATDYGANPDRVIVDRGQNAAGRNRGAGAQPNAGARPSKNSSTGGNDVFSAADAILKGGK